jgi:hypothetical protein
VDAKILIEKQRNGPLGKIDIVFHKSYASFYPRAWEPASASAASSSEEHETPF